MDELKEIDRPYQVHAVVGNEHSFHSAFIDKSRAEHLVQEANKEAEKLGIKARYILVVKEGVKTDGV